MNERKTNRKDRYDGYYVSDISSMHRLMPYLMPNRTDNECLLDYQLDMSQVVKYVNQKNEEDPQYKYTVFHVIMAAISKLIYLKPRLNYFSSGYRLYERKDLSFSFVAKNKMEEKADESLLIFKYNRDSDESPIEQVHNFVCKNVYKIRNENMIDDTTDVLDILSKFPRFILRIIFGILHRMSFYGKLPKVLRPIDPYSSSVFITNLGSIKMSADYHHLANWSTNSLFVIIGELKKQPYFNDDGSYVMKDALNLGVTVDERIADGFYFARCIKLLQRILLNPEVLEQPISSSLDLEEEV